MPALCTAWLSCAYRRSAPSDCVDAPVTRSSASCAPCSGTRRTTPWRACCRSRTPRPRARKEPAARGGRQRHVHREGPQREPATADRNDPGQPAVEACNRTLESADRRSGNGSVRARHPRHLAAGRRARLDQTFGDHGGVCRSDHRRADRRSGPVGTRVASGRSQAGNPLQPGYDGNGRARCALPLRRAPSARTADLTGSGAFTPARGEHRACGSSWRLHEAGVAYQRPRNAGRSSWCGSGERRSGSGRRLHVPAGLG